LTKVQLFICKDSMVSCSFHLAIRSELDGENLVELSIEPDIISEYPDYSWVDFDFEDIQVDMGETYYIIAYVEGVGIELYYWGSSNNTELYQNGTMHMSYDNVWEECLFDLCFKTYGCMEKLPKIEIKSITGGMGLEVEIKNVGSANSTKIEVNLSVSGGLLVNPRESIETKDILIPGETISITFQVFGLGLGILSDIPTISIKVESLELDTLEKIEDAKIIGSFVILQ